MSRLSLRTNSFGTFDMNVVSFNSPIFASASGVQTKTMLQVFPVKANQPEIQFNVIFRSEYDYQRFQQYIRYHQQFALSGTTSPEITLYWPERNMLNWTGVIKQIRAGGMRFNPAPKATFTVDLIDSMVSRKTLIQSLAAPFSAITGTTLQLMQNGAFQLPRQVANTAGQPQTTQTNPVLPAAGG